MTEPDIWQRLAALFPSSDIEWRVQSSGVTDKGPWIKAVPYIQADAIQNRLDWVVGVPNWNAEYREISGGKGGFICQLSVRTDEDGPWVRKEDGANFTNVEPIKGGISDALKRAASAGYGMGRYLRDVPIGFVACGTQRRPDANFHQIKDKSGKVVWTGYWLAPELPDEFVPADERAARAAKRAAQPSGDPYGNEPPL